MKTLNEIVHSILLEKGYPIHFYSTYLKYAAAILRELLFDTLKITNTTVFEGGKEYTLPADCIDVVRIGLPIRQDTGKTISVYSCDYNGDKTEGGEYWRLGGYFGVWHYDGFIVDKGTIKLRQPGPVVLQYLTDGSHIDNASMIVPYAQAAIEQGCEWKYKKFNRSHHPNEAKLEKLEFDVLHARLRSRLNPMTVQDVRKVLQKAMATPFKG